MCIGVTERPERKNVSGLCAPAGICCCKTAKLDHGGPERQKEAHHKLSYCIAHLQRRRIGTRWSRHGESKLLAPFFAKFYLPLLQKHAIGTQIV
jgi:hypothetical protein